MRKNNARVMVEVSLLVAVAMLLSLIKFWRMPQGGSVSFEMLPIFVLAFRRGGRIGILGGFLLGALKLFISPYIIHPVQLLLDYPLPYAVLGVAGFGFLRKTPLLGIFVGSFLRLVIHVTSGVVFFAAYAPEGTPVLLYSIGYNGSFLIVETILVVGVFLFLRRRRELVEPLDA